MDTRVHIAYFGKYKIICGVEGEGITVDSDIAIAGEQIQSFLRKKYDILPPYSLLLDGLHLISAVKNRADRPLKDGDVFQLLSFHSGG